MGHQAGLALVSSGADSTSQRAVLGREQHGTEGDGEKQVASWQGIFSG